MNYPYYQPNYQQNYQPTYQQPQNQGLNWVQGETGAKSWIVGRGETVFLMDSENPIFYIKSSDASGMPLPLRIFDYTERTQAPKQAEVTTDGGFVTREEYNGILAKYEELKCMIDDMQKSKSATRTKGAQANE